jgi:hypothetical protein
MPQGPAAFNVTGMRRGRVRSALVLALLTVGLGYGCALRVETSCSGVYTEYLRQGELETQLQEEARAAVAAQDPLPGLGRSVDPREAALVAGAAGLQVMVDHQGCFKPVDVAQAKTRLRAVEEQLSQFRAGS